MVIAGTEVATEVDVATASADGTLVGNVLTLESPLRDYRVSGTLYCTGALCDLAGFPPIETRDYRWDVPLEVATGVTGDPAFSVNSTVPVQIEISDVNAGPGLSTIRLSDETGSGALEAEAFVLPNPACPGEPLDSAIIYLRWSGVEQSREFIPAPRNVAVPSLGLLGGMLLLAALGATGVQRLRRR